MKKLITYIVFCFLLSLSPNLQAAEMTMTTYYPALSGGYDQVRFLPRSVDLTNPCTIGTLYVNSTNNLQYCRDNGGIGVWGTISDTWTQNGNDVYLDDITLKVGIGTKTPEFKLSLSNDAGIIAKGTFASGETLPNGLGTGSRLIWYPRKAAFRAGYVSGNQWDNANIGDYSSAFGKDSTASGAYSVVGGGDTNTASGQYSNVIGGQNNSANDSYCAVTGGQNNRCNGQYSTITGGYDNAIDSEYTTILGGSSNQADATHTTIGGGASNSVSTPYSNINGGQGNVIDQIEGTAIGYSVIGGGKDNKARNDYTVISGGQNNTAVAPYASIGGGSANNAGAVTTSGLPGTYSRISGGQTNSSTGDYSTISGGQDNTAMTSYSTIVGGKQNIADNAYSVIGGGERNTASGDYSMIMGGTDNIAAGDYSWAGGKNMRLTASADRTFVWGYSDTPISITKSDAFIIAPGTRGGNPWWPSVGIRDLNPSGVLEINANSTNDDFVKINRFSTNIFIIKRNGYIGIEKPIPTLATHAMQFGNANNAYLSGGGAWVNGSSRKFKENIAPLTSQDAQEALQKLTPITFNYKISRQTNAGFIAEDVPEIVAMKDRKSLSAMDIVAVLTKVSQDQEQAIQTQKEKIEKIRKEIETLKKMIGD